MSSASETDRLLRRDARENRERIVDAARGAFAELGVEVSVEEIAGRAGVGVGTLYRRFPTKDVLVDAIFEEHLEDMAAAAARALDNPDAWDALRGYLAHVVARQAADRGLCEIVGAQLRTDALGAARARLRPLVQQVVERAQAAGELRPDVVYEDISVLLWTTGRVADATREAAPEFWERYLALLLDGLRAEGASGLPRPPLTEDEHGAAMQRFARPRSR